MRLFIEYHKTAAGKIGFQITVTDRGDFSNVYIFPTESVGKGLELKTLDGQYNKLYGVALDYLEAEKQVDTICNMITHHLTLWRGIGIPEDHSVEL